MGGVSGQHGVEDSILRPRGGDPGSLEGQPADTHKRDQQAYDRGEDGNALSEPADCGSQGDHIRVGRVEADDLRDAPRFFLWILVSTARGRDRDLRSRRWLASGDGHTRFGWPLPSGLLSARVTRWPTSRRVIASSRANARQRCWEARARCRARIALWPLRTLPAL